MAVREAEETQLPIAPFQKDLPLSRSEYLYTPFYCEENVYMLAKRLAETGAADVADLTAVFISNPTRSVPLWRQKAGKGHEGLVVWDYHVILVQSRPGGEAVVWDLDSLLPFPTLLQVYWREGLCNGLASPVRLRPPYPRLYRLVSMRTLLRCFASDRSHMRHAGTGEWLEVPPPYEAITAEDGATNNLHEYITMILPSIADTDDGDGAALGGSRQLGQVFDEAGFQLHFNLGSGQS